MYVCVDVHVRVYLCGWLCGCVDVYVCMYGCVYVGVCGSMCCVLEMLALNTDYEGQSHQIEASRSLKPPPPPLPRSNAWCKSSTNHEQDRLPRGVPRTLLMPASAYCVV